MKPTLILILLLSFGTTLAQKENNATEEMTKVIIEVNGMACQEGCADKISSNLNENAGIAAAEVSYEKKEAIVKFDPALISLPEIKSIITKTKVKEYIYTTGKTTIKEE